MATAGEDPKVRALRAERSLNPRPEAVATSGSRCSESWTRAIWCRSSMRWSAGRASRASRSAGRPPRSVSRARRSMRPARAR